MPVVCKFNFPKELDRETIEIQIALAIITAECFYGKPKVRIDASYIMSEDGSQIVIDITTEVGKFIAQVFTGLMGRQINEDKFTVEKEN